MSIFSRVSCLTTICLVILSLAGGCGKKPVEEGKITIEFMNWESTPVGLKFIEGLIETFEKKYPNIKVKNNVTPGYFETKVLTRFAGGDPPDIWETGESRDLFIRRNLILNPAPYVKKSMLLNDEDFFPFTLPYSTYDGKELLKGDVYVYPKDFATFALIYNQDIFDKEGLPYPDETWTGKEFLEAAKALTKRDESGRFIQFGMEAPPLALDILLQKGGRMWSEDYKRCLLDSKEAKEAYQYVYDLQEKHKVAPRIEDIAKGPSGWFSKEYGFVSGRTGMSIIGRFQLPDFIKNIGGRFKWNIAPYPLFGKERVYLLHGPTGWAISAKTKYPEACFHFLEVLVGPEGQLETPGYPCGASRFRKYADYRRTR